MIKRHFFTGLALLLPMVITLYLMFFFLNALTRPFQDLVERLLLYHGIKVGSILFFSSEQVLQLFSKGLTLIFLGMGTIATGMLTRVVAIHYLIQWGHRILHKIPLIRTIYHATQEVMKTLFSDEHDTFSQVVLVPFPHKKGYAIGMMTTHTKDPASDTSSAGLVSVFLPATPNPTMGFMVMYRRDELKFIDMKVEDALKTVISCGVSIETIQEV